MKKALVLGGTGAMGVPLVKLLSEKGFVVQVTSRKKHESTPEIQYIQGNAKDIQFIESLLTNADYDVIVDFMVYSPAEFEQRADMFLNATKQYIFISSARVYAPSNECITEESPRLLDTCKDKEYLATNDYAILKAKEENVLFKSKKRNWTIVRPSLTYNVERLQAPLGEKEDWLFRALHGQILVFPKDMFNIVQTMTFGEDVSIALSKLVDNPKAIGEVVNIAGADPITWAMVIDTYKKALAKEGIRPKICYIDNSAAVSNAVCNTFQKNQYKYARAIDRKFDNTKLFSIIGNMKFVNAEEGLSECVHEFMKGKKHFDRIPPQLFAYYDRITRSRTPLRYFLSKRDKLIYLYYRYFKCYNNCKSAK